MSTVLGGIKNIIFDFGGVLINLDFERTYKAFCGLGIADLEKRFTEEELIPVFYRLETGDISPDDFRSGLRKMTGINISSDQFDHAWNQLLLDIPAHRIELLKSLKGKYRLFLLSNTNKIHFDHYSAELKRVHKLDFADLFEHTWFSFEMGMAKPDTEIYKRVLREKNLNPKETLFIDDTFENIKGARRTGMRTLFLEGEIGEALGIKI
ncbi:MAG: hypothetical protein A2W91_14535 [Bacteroidetes bacterium GWF2_38_335]|nr:MAG: hypothetical protein A2W91_14535 [Bacteroidetes bacterium GWF2_38_335]OFY79324.1 MAG: hypothetical protein A2281_16620 [Bacteroidetes bacterium RIFOXYA12_FULL_38_20]HBS85582.1 HAD family phosphatase [Bacteroidales bacterium]